MFFQELSAVSSQQSGVSGQPKATLREWLTLRKQLSVTQIKQMLTCCLDAIASGGNHGSRSWGRPPRPRCLPKTALHRLFKS
ncbi:MULTISPECIES: hypothetical protein [unclassified Moorena]|uniref:hypothetical protein n=1 Tax=unclassified Moorena TaxID=2683338 RepID=UPI0025D1427C|nr:MULTISPECIES: hypothetical protein [unclassified Moorena]